MSIKGYKTLTVVLAELVGVLLTGCAMNSGRSMAGFALSTPSHNQDWDWLQSALKAEGDLHTHFWLALPIIGRLLI